MLKDGIKEEKTLDQIRSVRSRKDSDTCFQLVYFPSSSSFVTFASYAVDRIEVLLKKYLLFGMSVAVSFTFDLGLIWHQINPRKSIETVCVNREKRVDSTRFNRSITCRKCYNSTVRFSLVSIKWRPISEQCPPIKHGDWIQTLDPSLKSLSTKLISLHTHTLVVPLFLGS